MALQNSRGILPYFIMGLCRLIHRIETMRHALLSMGSVNGV